MQYESIEQCKKKTIQTCQMDREVVSRYTNGKIKPIVSSCSLEVKEQAFSQHRQAKMMDAKYKYIYAGSPK